MESLEGKHFSITDPVNVNTVVYRLDETEKEFAKNSPKFTIQRLDYTSEYVGEKTKKTFYIDDPSPEGNSLIILSLYLLLIKKLFSSISFTNIAFSLVKSA